MNNPVPVGESEELARRVRNYVMAETVASGQVPQAPAIAAGLGRPQQDIELALRLLAEGRVLILAPNTTTIWAANPFCAVPTAFRVEARGLTYYGICIWDALGIAAALGTDATIQASCGDCGASLSLQVRDGSLQPADGLIHFAVPARQWWDNIGFT